MHETKRATLRVAGATLFYQMRGSGPVLLLIHAATADAESFADLATHLASQYTVVSYDRRGYARSPLNDPEEEPHLETHSDDASRLLALLGTEPAYVFASSGGALIGLDLAIRHPEQVQVLVAHEPLVRELLTDGEVPALLRHEPSLRRDAMVTARRKDWINLEMSQDDREPDVVWPSPSSEARARLAANYTFSSEHEAEMYLRYTLDLATLAVAPTQIMIAAGRASRGYVLSLAAARLAERLRTSPGGVSRWPCGLHEPSKSIRRAVTQRSGELTPTGKPRKQAPLAHKLLHEIPY
jgi:pimeloyl-ACP methyl ester carboxylesterase